DRARAGGRGRVVRRHRGRAQLHLHEDRMSVATRLPSASPSPSPRHPQRRPTPRRAARGMFRASVILVLGVPVLVVLPAGAAFWMLLYGNLPGTFPKPKPIKQAQPSVVYDAAGNQIATFRTFDISVPMKKSQIPQDLKDAAIANEDRKFYSHRGVDPEGMV